MTRSILDANLYAKARLPLGEAEALPPWCYTSPEFYGAEVERVFRRTWNFVGHESEIADPGDYKTVDVLGDSIIVLRDRAGALRAFANSCRHRGTRLLSGNGRCRLITCPYHSWAFNLSGDLVRSGKAYVKISGAYRASTKGPDYPDAAPLARDLTS